MLALDREHKGSLYARAGIADYWIVNLMDDALEVYRVPSSEPATSFGWRYGSAEVLRRGASISPLALSGVHIRVADLLL
jgi:Uma2 family endonuclease